MTEREAHIAFNTAPGIGMKRFTALAKKHGGAVAAWEAFSTTDGRENLRFNWERELELAAKTNVTIITPVDDGYPIRLRRLSSPPLALYVTGEVSVLSDLGVAVVGTREPTLYGLDMAKEFAAGIARDGMTVISGLAMGVDASAHKGALAAGGVSIGVLGSALDHFFPEDNRKLAREMVAKGGAVISEFPFGHPPGKSTFPRRNHTVAALSRGVLSVEAPLQSGTLITCDIARELGIPVMAIPANLDSVNSAGCWKLIREGAVMVTRPEEVTAICQSDSVKPEDIAVFRRKNPERESPLRSASRDSIKNACASGLTAEESAVLKAIPSTGITLDRLSFVTKIPAAVISAVIPSLMTKKRVRHLPGNRVASVRGNLF